VKKIFHFFFRPNGDQRPGFVLITSLLIPTIFAVWGIRLTYVGLNNTEQIDTLAKLIRQSQRQIDILQKISGASDSTNKSTQTLRELPRKLGELSTVLDTLNFTIGDETKKLESSYNSLNNNYALLITQQKSYLDKISKVVELTNLQISQLQKNNELINNEYSRRGNISVTCSVKKIKDRYYLDLVSIKNEGSIECDVESFLFSIVNKDCNCSDSINKTLDIFRCVDKNVFVLKINEVDRKRISNGFPMSMSMKSNCSFPSKDIQMVYSLTYTNKYENKTIQNSVLVE
jgi:hypothetical protein